MSESTIFELAEVIADQSCQIRELQNTVLEQERIISAFQVGIEDDEKTTRDLYVELKELSEDPDVCRQDIQSIIDSYFMSYSGEE